MAKTKTKAVKKKSGKKEIDPPFMPTIVDGLAKMVERLEVLERKVDQIQSRISNVLFEIRDNLQQNNHQNAGHEQNPFAYSNRPHQQSIAPQRMMYQAVCADCKKNCEVPFKPGSRPVYCKECFAARKAGHPMTPAPKLSSAVGSTATAVIDKGKKASKKSSAKPKKKK